MFGSAGLALSCGSKETKTTTHEKPFVNTVTGRISPDEMGFTLPHEHIIVDWKGGDGKSRERYDPDEIYRVMLPYLYDIKEFGVQTFVDCSPQYFGRDVLVLKRLAKATGLHIVTCTGLYEKSYAPRIAFDYPLERIADMFTGEILEGIEGTGIHAGFVKIAVSNTGPVTPNDEKIVTAACRTNKITGATIHSHTFQGTSALTQIDILERENVDPAAFVYMHAGFETDITFNIEAAKRGVWVEYDSIRADTSEKHLTNIRTLLDLGFENQLLLSQDRGWYTIGEAKGGNINPYTYFPEVFVPLLKEKGLDDKLIHKLTVMNPAKACSIQA
ncbi:Phosphotriesterase homology protein [subsurface metagenome]